MKAAKKPTAKERREAAQACALEPFSIPDPGWQAPPLNPALRKVKGNRDALVQIALQTNNLLEALHVLAANGSQEAAHVWFKQLAASVNKFELLATHRPQLFEKIARKSLGIPACISRSSEKGKDNQRLLKQLHQGEDAVFSLLPTGKQGASKKMFEGVNFLAARLVAYVAYLRDNGFLLQAGVDLGGPALPTWAKTAKALKAFSRETWKQWADLAWLIVLDASDGEPEKHSDLAPIGAAKGRVTPKYCKTLHSKTSESNARGRIKESITEAFARLAGVPG